MPITESKSTSTHVTLKDGAPIKAKQTQSHSKTQSTTRKTYDEKYPFSSFLNIPTFVILFVMVMIGSSVMFYNANIDTYMPTLDAEGVRQPYRVEYLNDQPISELNGLTLNEVFEDNIIAENVSYIDVYRAAFSNIDTYLGNENDYYYYAGIIDMKSHNNATSASIQNSLMTPSISIDVYTIALHTFSFKGQFTKQDTYRVRQDTGTSTYDLIIHYQINLTDLGIDNLTKEQMDYYYNLYQEQDGETFDNYYYLSTEDYSALGQTAVTGYEVAFNEGGIFDSALNLVGTVQDVLMQAVNTLKVAYNFFSISILGFKDNTEFDYEGQLDRFGTEYDDIPKTKLEVIYRSLPKWMQPDTWFD